MDGGAADLGLEHRRHSPPRELSSPPIPDELLLDIFRRIHSPADLVRTSAACVSFRRLVADRSFLRQYRRLHGPPLLGFLDAGRNFHPPGPPHPSAPAASAVALAADFSFAFLPAPASGDWVVEDARDGRVLLGRSFKSFDICDNLTEIVVCDPLHRQYLLLPPVPHKLFRELRFLRKIFLVPPVSSVDKEEEETEFRVIWMARRLRGDKLVAIVFSSSTGQWQGGPSHSWSSSFDGLLNLPGDPNFSGPQYAYGCFYWVTHCREHLLVLDTQRMEFSLTVAPPEAKGSADVVADIAIVEAGEGRAGIFVRPEYTNDHLNYSIRQNNCVSSCQWRFERTVSLDFKFSLMGSAGTHLFLFQCQNKSCFSLDVRTFQLERVFVSDSCVPYGHIYSNFPPSLLSAPTISSGVEEGAEKVMLEQCCAPSSSAQSSQPSE